MADKPSTGLADIIAASTALSDIDGRAGLQLHRGHDVHRLAGPAAFGEIAYPLRGRPSWPDREHAGERGLTRAAAGRR